MAARPAVISGRPGHHRAGSPRAPSSLRLDAARAKADLEEPAGRLSAQGETHAGVHVASMGWVLPHLHDPDGHKVRFYTTQHHTEPGADPLTVQDPRETGGRGR